MEIKIRKATVYYRKKKNYLVTVTGCNNLSNAQGDSRKRKEKEEAEAEKEGTKKIDRLGAVAVRKATTDGCNHAVASNSLQ